jgi:hypothetical protein
MLMTLALCCSLGKWNPWDRRRGMSAFVRRTIALSFFMFALTSSLGAFVSKVPAAVKIMMGGGWRIAFRISVSVLPLRCCKQIVEHSIQLLWGICIGHLNLDGVKGFIMHNMLLRRYQFCFRIVDENDIAGMIQRMANINTLVTPFFPFSRTKGSRLESFIEDVDR